MTIQNYFFSFLNHYITQVKHQDSQAAVSVNTHIVQLEIPRETLSKAILDQQSDGTLRWMTFNRSKCRIFKNDEQLDHYLSKNELVDIWEIEDKRDIEPNTIYKYCDTDESNTFSTKEELYRKIASLTDNGAFRIHDVTTQEDIYILQKHGWFQRGFEEVSSKEALETIFTRETAKLRRCKIYALGIAALAAAPVLVGLGKTLSKNWSGLRAVNVIPSYPTVQILQKITTIFSTALITYGMSRLDADPRKSFSTTLSAAVLGTLSWPRLAKAQICPQLAGSYNTLDQALSVVVSGNYAYVADGNSGLQIIDVSNVTSPVRVGFYDTPGTAIDVAVLGSYAYVADWNSGLQVIDVSNVTNPVRVGFYNTPGDAFEVAVSGSYAYVADRYSGLQIIDVSNVTNPVRVGFWDTPGAALGVMILGSYAYVADWNSGLQVIDVSNVTNPVSVGFYDTPGNAYDVAVSGSYAYVADQGSGLQIIDVSNVTNPVRVGFYDTPDFARHIAVSGSYAYVADQFSGLQIIDVSNVTNPVRVGLYDTPASARGIAVSGSYVYVADHTSGLQIIDVYCLFSNTSSCSTTSSSTTNSASSSTSTNLSILPSSPSTTLMSSRQLNSSISSTSSNIYSLSDNPRLLWIGLGIGIAGSVCLGVTGTTLFFLLKKRKPDLVTGSFDRESSDLSVAKPDKPKTRKTELPSLKEERDLASKETPYHNVPSIPTEFHAEQYHNLDKISTIDEFTSGDRSQGYANIGLIFPLEEGKNM